MLYAINGKSINSVPHRDEFNTLKARLSDSEYKMIMETLNSKIGSGEVHTSNWMPSKEDWKGPFLPIYKAAKGDYELSGKFFGLLVWEAFMNHSGHWTFVKNTKDESQITGMTYFPYK